MPPSDGCQFPGHQIANLAEDVLEKLLADEVISIEADEDAAGKKLGSAGVGAILATRGVPIVEMVIEGTVPLEILQDAGTRRGCAIGDQGRQLLVEDWVHICKDLSS